VSTGSVNAAIDLEACARRGVVVGWAPSQSVGFDSTSEMTWALILALHKRLPQQDAALRQGRWQTHLTETVVGKTLGLLGLGRIGSNVARVGAVFGMDLIAWSPNLDAAGAAAKGVRRVDRQELFASSDVLSLHMVLSPRSAGIVDRAALRSMKPGAYLVNTARAGLVEEGALLEALDGGWIAGAALDVYPVEPLEAGDPILRHDNVVLSPHLGYVTGDTMRSFYGNAVARIRRWMDTGR
jgi:phosphoglycerate dehydrogenase-like enzyme